MEIMIYYVWDNKRASKRKGGQMFTIVIGEEERYEEYRRRLVRYLEARWKGPLRIYSFTQPQKLLQVGEADCYLFGEKFVEEIRNNDELSDFYRKMEIRNREIVISDNEQRGYFCRYHAPAELLHRIQEHMSVLCQEKLGEELESEGKPYRVTGIFSPVFDSHLKNIVVSYMNPGDLYLGMEDMNDLEDPGGSMGDLCYYIHLRDEELLLHIGEIAGEYQGRYYVESPEVYLDLLELDEEEYQWFFDRLRKEKGYPEIFVGMECGVFRQGEILKFFDRLVLVDSRENQYQHVFCSHLEKAIEAGVIFFDGVIERRYREDVLHESL